MEMEFFSKVKDPRVLGKVKHEPEDVLRIVLIGVLCSCEDYDEISDFIEEREYELREMGFLDLPNGVPSGDTIRCVVEAYNLYYSYRQYQNHFQELFQLQELMIAYKICLFKN